MVVVVADEVSSSSSHAAAKTANTATRDANSSHLGFLFLVVFMVPSFGSSYGSTAPHHCAMKWASARVAATSSSMASRSNGVWQ